MLRIGREGAAAVCANLLVATLAAGQNVRGRIEDVARPGNGVPSITVSFARADLRAHNVLADSAGNFALELRPGTYTVKVVAPGYALARNLDLTVADQPQHDLVLQVKVVPIPVDSLVVATPSSRLLRTGFHERMRSEVGAFIDRATIEQRKPRVLSDIFLRVNGVRIVRVETGRAGGAANFVLMRTGCLPRVFLDGVEVVTGGLSVGTTRSTVQSSQTMDRRQLARYSIDELIPPNDVEAIEVYRGPAQVPAQFGGSAAQCGAIVIWSR